jgi:uncharacterized protein
MRYSKMTLNNTSEGLFVSSLEPKLTEAIGRAIDAIESMDYAKARELLEPLVNSGVPSAIYYMASFSFPHESLKEFESRHLRQIKDSAELGFPPAIHKLGIYYDSGDFVKRDTKKAALLFKSAAENAHPHSEWIYGLDLLYGKNNIAKNEELGLTYIKRAFESKFEGALQTVAEFYQKGIFGFRRDSAKAELINEEIERGNIIRY